MVIIGTNEKIVFDRIVTYTGAKIDRAMVSGVLVYRDRFGDLYAKVRGVTIRVMIV